jgi:Rrf2 family nitric oxide-sensitive transcriptional repressor
MQLKKFTDYSLRLLIQLAVNPDEWISINAVASAFDISRNHLLKVVTELSRQGLIQTQRGKHGGLKLNRPAAQINVGELIASLEGSSPVVDCRSPICPILPACGLKSALDEAEAAFYQSLHRYSLEDLVHGQERKILKLISA